MTLKEENDYFECDVAPHEQYHALLEMEHRQLLSEHARGFSYYQPDSHYVKSGKRKQLISHLMSFIAKKTGVTKLTLHSTVKLMDRVMSFLQADMNDVASDHYELILYACLLLSSKFEELDRDAPQIWDIVQLSKYKIQYNQLKNAQNELISLLDFDLMVTTQQHFLN